MKRLTKLSSVFVVMLLFASSSCSDLSPDPKSFFNPNNVYIDESGFESLLVTMRKNLMYENTGWHHPIAMDHILSDVAITIDPADLRDVTPSNGPIWPYLSYFDNAYAFIKDSNVLISRIDEVDFESEESRNSILAEAYWHRAYWYYRLVHTYGDVPWIGEELEGAKLDFQTYEREAILDKIQADLEWAEEWLPQTIPSQGKVTKAAATHLLTKVYLANLDYDSAISAASRLIDGPHALMTERFGIDADDPTRNVQWDLHRWQNKNSAQNTEAIYATIDRPDVASGARSGGSYSFRNWTPSYWKILDENGNRMCNWSTPTGDTLGIGDSNVRTNNYWHYEIWNDGTYTWENTPDERRADINWTEMREIQGCHEGSPQNGEPFTKEFYGSLVDTFDTWYPWPQYKTFVLSPNTRLPVGGEADWYIFRLAETYLLRAEAYFWKGQLGPAANDINTVRDRANAPLITAGEVTIDYIFDERARELYMEEPRHSEMVRASYIMAAENRNGYSMDSFSEDNWFYDRVIELNDNYHESEPIWRGDVSHIDPYNVLMPIPQSVIEANTQGNINQNEGYDGAQNNEPPLEEISE
jgi:hypothetical protein